MSDFPRPDLTFSQKPNKQRMQSTSFKHKLKRSPISNQKKIRNQQTCLACKIASLWSTQTSQENYQIKEPMSPKEATAALPEDCAQKTVQRRWRNDNFQERRSEASEQSISSLQHDHEHNQEATPTNRFENQKASERTELYLAESKTATFSPAPMKMIARADCLPQPKALRLFCSGWAGIVCDGEQWILYDFGPLIRVM